MKKLRIKRFFSRKNMIKVCIMKLFQFSLLTPVNAQPQAVLTTTGMAIKHHTEKNYSITLRSAMAGCPKKSTYTAQFTRITEQHSTRSTG